MPGVLGNDTNGESVLRVGAGEAVQREQLLAGERRDVVVVERLEDGRVHRPVDLAPVDLRFARRFADREFVVRRAPGVPAGQTGQRTLGGQHGLIAANRLLIEDGGR